MERQKGIITRIGEWLDDKKLARERNLGQPNNLARWLPTPGNIAFTLFVAAMLILTQIVWANPGKNMLVPGPSAYTINYQGRLADINGLPLTGSHTIEFSIWDAESGGSLIWPGTGTETHPNVPVVEGLFSVGLGSQTAGGIPTNVWDGDRYLQITVDGDTLSPRELIRSVPIASLALTVPNGAIGTDQIADGAVNSMKVSLDHGEIVGTANLTPNASYQTIPGLSLTTDYNTDQSIILDYNLDAETSVSSGVMIIKLFVDGVGASAPIVLGRPGETDRVTISAARAIFLPAGQHTIEIKALNQSGATGGVIRGANSSMTYLSFAQTP